MKLIAFSEALLEFHRDAQRAKIYLQDKRLTNNERKILYAWYALKDSQHDEALELVKGIPGNEYPVILAQAKIIKGVAYNNSGKFQESAKVLEESIKLMEKGVAPELRFIPHYNLFITYFNLSSSEGMERCLRHLQQIKTSLPRQKICRLQCELNLAVFLESEEALELIQELDSHLPQMNPAMAMTHLSTVFMWWVKRGEYQEAEKTLDRIKSYRMFRSSANYNFMKVLLEHLQKKKPIYINQERFKDSEFLYTQLRFLEALERNELEEAQRFWSRLAEMEPGKYKSDFTYLGQKGLFSLCLELHRPKTSTEDLLTKLPSNKLEAFEHILKNSSRPVNKNEIFALIYGHGPKDVQDDNRLRNLIFQARKKYGEAIKFKKGCYYWEEPSKSKKVG